MSIKLKFWSEAIQALFSIFCGPQNISAMVQYEMYQVVKNDVLA